MKRFIGILLSVVLLVTFVSCKEKSESIQEPANFYYCTPIEEYETNHNVITAETREIIQCNKDIKKILSLYLSGPASEAYHSPFPAKTQLVSVQQEDSKVFVVLSSEFSQLTGFDLSVACACISLTIFDLTAYDDVSIRSEDSLLDGNEAVSLSREDLLLSDEVFIQDVS